MAPVCVCPAWMRVRQPGSGGPSAHAWGARTGVCTELAVFSPRLGCGRAVYRASSCAAIYSPLFSPLGLCGSPVGTEATSLVCLPLSLAAVRGWPGWLERLFLCRRPPEPLHLRSPDGIHFGCFLSCSWGPASAKLARGWQTSHHQVQAE